MMTVPADNQPADALLAIGIPTFNRAKYLKDLLLALEQQIRESDIPTTDVQIFVSDNASSDNTPAVVQEVAARLPHLRYVRQPQNIGAGLNIIACAREARGKFCWVCGDDELLQAGGLKSLLQLLKQQEDLSLVISLCAKYACELARPARFASYREYARACALQQPHVLIEHTLVSSNIFRAGLFDAAVGTAKLGTSFPHMYALLNPVIERGGPVALPAFPLIAVRDVRPPFAEWPKGLEQNWREYLGWQKRMLNLPELNPEQAIEQVRKDLLHRITRHPIKFIRTNLWALRPSAWPLLARRLMSHLYHRPPLD